MSEFMVYRTFKASEVEQVLRLVSQGWSYRPLQQPPKKAAKTTRIRRKRTRCKPFTQDERLEMVRLHKSGLSARIIAKRMRGSMSGIHNAIRRTKAELGEV